MTFCDMHARVSMKHCFKSLVSCHFCRSYLKAKHTDVRACRNYGWPKLAGLLETQRVISLFGLVFSLSTIATCTHTPQGVIIVGIYMSSNIYYYYYYTWTECGQIGLQTCKCDIFANICKPTRLHHSFSFSIIIIKYLRTCKSPQ